MKNNYIYFQVWKSVQGSVDGEPSDATLKAYTVGNKSARPQRVEIRCKQGFGEAWTCARSVRCEYMSTHVQREPEPCAAEFSPLFGQPLKDLRQVPSFYRIAAQVFFASPW